MPSKEKEIVVFEKDQMTIRIASGKLMNSISPYVEAYTSDCAGILTHNFIIWLRNRFNF